MYNHNKAQQSKNRVHISWDILYLKYAIFAGLNTGIISLWSTYFMRSHQSLSAMHDVVEKNNKNPRSLYQLHKNTRKNVVVKFIS